MSTNWRNVLFSQAVISGCIQRDELMILCAACVMAGYTTIAFSLHTDDSDGKLSDSENLAACEWFDKTARSVAV